MPEAFELHRLFCAPCHAARDTAALCATGRYLQHLAERVPDLMSRIRSRMGADARLGAVEDDGQIHEHGYGHGV